MADAAPSPPADDAPPAAAAPAKKKKGLPVKLIAVIGGVVVVQGGLLFGLFKFLGGGPKSTQAEPSTAAHEEQAGEHAAAPSSGDHGTPSAAADHGKSGHGSEHGAKGAEGRAGDIPPPPAGATAEVQLVKGFRVPNDKSGRMFIYDLEVSVVVPGHQAEAFKALAAQRLGEVQDRIGRVVRSASDKMLREDDLEMLRSQIREELSEMLTDGQRIERVLIPRLVPLPT